MGASVEAAVDTLDELRQRLAFTERALADARRREEELRAQLREARSKKAPLDSEGQAHVHRDVFEVVFDQIPVMLIVVDPSGMPKLVNRHWETVMGWTLEEIRDRDVINEFYPDPEDRRKVREYIRNPVSGWIELKTRVRDGRIVDTAWAMACLPDGTRIGFGTDITQRKQDEERLRWSQMLLAEAQELAHIGSWNWDMRSGVLDWSDEQYRLFGLERSAELLTFERIMPCFHPADQVWIRDAVAHARDVELLDEVTLRAIRPEGGERLLLSRGRVVHDEAGNPIRMFGTCQDVTRQKTIEKALAESRNRSQAIFEYSSEAILLIDDQTRYVDANPAACELLGYSREELLRLSVRDITPHSASVNIEAMFREFVDAGAMNGEYVVLRKDGQTRDVEFCSVANILPGLHLGVHHDITERKRIQAERERLHKEAAANGELLGRLSRRLIDSHETERRNLARELHDEVGQVMTTVSLNLESLRAHVDPRFWPGIDDSLQVVDLAIDQVRNLSMDLRPASLDMLGLETALRAYLGRQSKRAGIVLRMRSGLDSRRFSSTLETVCFRVAQEAFTNVVRHAHAKECSVTLAVDAETLHLSISDDGVGFDFEAARQRGQRGEGFGLFSMLERVHLYGGRIDVASTPEIGTTIKVALPLSPSTR